MRWMLPGALALVLNTGACAPASKLDTPATPPETPATPMAKRAPPQPGEKISPVVAFRGHAADWDLQIENDEGYAHSVEFHWDNSTAHASGSLQYQPEASVGDAIVLSGTLDTHAGAKSMQVEIAPVACSDGVEIAYTHSVRINIDGMPPLHGCGDLAK